MKTPALFYLVCGWQGGWKQKGELRLFSDFLFQCSQNTAFANFKQIYLATQYTNITIIYLFNFLSSRFRSFRILRNLI